jgi:hypothetical protein
MESRTRSGLVVVQEELGVEKIKEAQREAELEQVRSATVTIVRAD